MDIKIRCPHCGTKLIVDDDLVGKSVLCEDCDKQFTVERPANSASSGSSSGERPRDRDRDEEEEKPRSRRRDDDDRPRSRDDFDDEDDRPRRRRAKGGGGNLAPIVFGSLLLVMTTAVGVGLFFAFGFNAPRGGSAGGGGGAPPANGQRFRISGAEWRGGNAFQVVVEAADGRPDLAPLRLVFRSDDGLSGKHVFGLAFEGRTTLFVTRGGFGRSRTTMWVEPEPPGPGAAAVSNTYVLN